MRGLSEKAWLQNLALCLLMILSLLLLVQTLGKAFRVVGYDFTVYLRSAAALIDGTDPYHTESFFPYTYPLTLAFCIIPLTWLPYWLSCVIWFLISLVVLALSGRITIVLLRRTGLVLDHRKLPIAILLLVTAMFSTIQNNLLNGQVNFIVLFFCLLFLKFFIEGKFIRSSVALSIAISLKLVPLILLGFLVFRKKVSVILLTLTLSTVMLFAPALITGQKILDYYSYYLNSFLLFNLDGRVSERIALNISYVLKVFFGLGTGSNSLLSVISFGLILSGIEIYSLRKRGAEVEVWRFCLYLLGILFISPMSQKHYLAYLFPSVGVGFAFFCLGRLRNNALDGWLLMLSLLNVVILAETFDRGPFYFIGTFLLFLLVSRQILFLSMGALPSRTAAGSG